MILILNSGDKGGINPLLLYQLVWCPPPPSGDNFPVRPCKYFFQTSQLEDMTNIEVFLAAKEVEESLQAGHNQNSK